MSTSLEGECAELQRRFIELVKRREKQLRQSMQRLDKLKKQSNKQLKVIGGGANPVDGIHPPLDTHLDAHLDTPVHDKQHVQTVDEQRQMYSADPDEVDTQFQPSDEEDQEEDQDANQDEPEVHDSFDGETTAQVEHTVHHDEKMSEEDCLHAVRSVMSPLFASYYELSLNPDLQSSAAKLCLDNTLGNYRSLTPQQVQNILDQGAFKDASDLSSFMSTVFI